MNIVRNFNEEIENLTKYQREVTKLKNAVIELEKKYTGGVCQETR